MERDTFSVTKETMGQASANLVYDHNFSNKLIQPTAKSAAADYYVREAKS